MWSSDPQTDIPGITIMPGHDCYDCVTEIALGLHAPTQNPNQAGLTHLGAASTFGACSSSTSIMLYATVALRDGVSTETAISSGYRRTIRAEFSDRRTWKVFQIASAPPSHRLTAAVRGRRARKSQRLSNRQPGYGSTGTICKARSQARV